MSAAVEAGASSSEIVTEREGSLGLVRLDRPKALNATTLAMIRAIDAALDGFERDPAVAAVAIEGAGGRAFCAGGDIRAIHASGLAGDGYAESFWREEYRLVARIARFQKPFVALMDGLVMGGGVGLSAHAAHRVATERTSLAMPEIGIGFAPDIGATWVLRHAPGMSGRYLVLTGEAIGAADAIRVGFADVCVPSARLPDLRAALAALPKDADGGIVNEALRGFATTPEPGPLERDAAAIDAAFGHDRMEAILGALASSGSEFGARVAKTLEEKSPTSLKLALELDIRAKASSSLEECLAREFGVAMGTLKGRDVYEGVRAAVIDKDRSPRWSPATLAEVDDAAIAACFEADAGQGALFLGRHART